MATECLFNSLWILRSDFQQCSGRAMRMPSTLLPISQSSHADTEHECELVLRFLELFPDCLNIFWSEGELATRLCFASQNTPALTNAFQQLLETLSFHLNSCRTSWARTLR